MTRRRRFCFLISFFFYFFLSFFHDVHVKNAHNVLFFVI